MVGLLQPLSDIEDHVGLMFELNVAWRRSLIRALQGKAPQKNRLMIDEISAIFLRYGCNIEPYLKSKIITNRYRARDHLAIVVRSTLAKATYDGPLRYELEAEIMAAVAQLNEAWSDYTHAIVQQKIGEKEGVE